MALRDDKGFDAGVPPRRKPVEPGAAKPLLVVVAPGARIDPVGAKVDRIARGRILPARAGGQRRHRARITAELRGGKQRVGDRGIGPAHGIGKGGAIAVLRPQRRGDHLRQVGQRLLRVPGRGVGAIDHARLQHQRLRCRQRHQHTRGCGIVQRIGDRTGVKIVVRGKRCLDIGHPDIAADADQQPFGQMRHEQFGIDVGQIEPQCAVRAVKPAIDKKSARCGVAVIRTIKAGDAKAPVHMIVLHRIGGALDDHHRLIELHMIGRISIARGLVALAHVAG